MNIRQAGTLADGLLTALYAALFLIALRSVSKTRLYWLLIGAAVSVGYNVAYSFTAYSVAASALALAARLAIGVESCARVATSRVQRLALWMLAAGSIEACLWPGATWHYLPSRHIATTVTAGACLLFAWLPAQDLYVRHVRLTGAWLSAQAVMSWTLPLYNVSWERRIAARWLYTLFVAALVAGWHATFRPARPESAYRLPPE